MTPRAKTLCIIGAGPRGLSVLERLCANERAEPAHSAVTVHVVEPFEPGAGAVWRTDQSRHLLMNTVASQITVHTDASSRIEGPVEPGPSLAEWAKSLVLTDSATGRDDQTLAEARDLNPDSYPTRALYGSYLADMFQRVVRGAPGHLTVEIHRSRAVVLMDSHGVADGRQAVGLGDGTWLRDLDAVVMAQGHVPVRLTAREERTASLARMHGVIYVPPANPADLDLSVVAPGEAVLLRGLGLNFFDHMTLLTQGRGGTFIRVHGRLTYRPSGQEPRMYASSRRGIPYHARGENEKGVSDRYYPRLLTPEFIAALRDRQGRRIGLRAELWPLIAREVEGVYYGTWLAAHGRGAERAAFVDRYLECAEPAGRRALLDAYGVPDAGRWNWERLSRPYGEDGFSDREAFRDWLLEYLRRDVQEARAGNVSGPLKAALDVLRDLRNEVRLAVDHAGLDGKSHRDELDGWYTPLNAFLSIGPPASRIEEMTALIEAGILELTGPATEIRIDAVSPAFVAVSRIVPGPPVRARVLIEARLHEPDMRRTTDPLLHHLLSTGQAMNHRVPTARATDHETGGLSVTERPYRLIDAQGQAHPRRFCYSVPTEGVHWVTAAGIRPGVDSVALADSDAIARAVLGLAHCSDLSAAPPGFQGALV
ncbi:FAD/NAD(P)-binding protein (plasmid) [Streptomyces sp. NBC_01340]|uniref:FAD/NAD(P)-binding protein n=1 Tax=unclassified Streptomyces TaxID=2593676 RepID=UPI00225B9608|nr:MULTISPECIES: FAD/NAD(P)-binding protein [unclassified Streptomyces]MCX4458638.1 FAD/NAD(P)-binding protein [Streptomyces sp. NBC_01719]MCX4460483.1 FAD/NAD(P)-binding protein [Streptomyces sp. NBC_01719]MCX4497995.1 FAD/NAD(P)-binding protein [Streptomyces sp. NBC_01728]MCX4500187.1 FAD/NAD(P)-binding protein [Streptomyces sp. NBC_01728]WSI45932.1 FAD/NAD(P)-binding protein [Streptomyces sp. NBC_01340]